MQMQKKILSPILGIPENELHFIRLVKVYGQGKWSEIARALARIYHIIIPRAKELRRIWEKLNAPNYVETPKQIQAILIISLNDKCKRRDMLKEMHIHEELMGRTSEQLMYTFKKYIRKGFQKLTQLFSRKKQETSKYLNDFKHTTFKKMLVMIDITTTHPFALAIQASAHKLTNALRMYADCNDQDRCKMYENMIIVITKREFELAFEHLKYVHGLILISKNQISKDNQIAKQSLLLEPTIAENKASEVYRLLFTNNTDNCTRNQMYEWYNQAKYENTAEYVFDVKLTNQPQKKIEFVEKTIKQIATVRGHITRPNKKLYRSCYSNRFHEDIVEDLKQGEQSAIPTCYDSLIQISKELKSYDGSDKLKQFQECVENQAEDYKAQLRMSYLQ